MVKLGRQVLLEDMFCGALAWFIGLAASSVCYCLFVHLGWLRLAGSVVSSLWFAQSAGLIFVLLYLLLVPRALGGSIGNQTISTHAFY